MIKSVDSINIKKNKNTWYMFALSLLILDQVTKYFVVLLLPLHGSTDVSYFFNIVHFRNEGAAFSLLADAGGWQRYFFACVASITSLWLIFMINKSQSMRELLGFSFVLGGALGNLSDRLLRGNVVDFLDFYWKGSHWPAFNFADVTIICGICLLISLIALPNSKVATITEYRAREQ
jgi:signal peptidase II